MIAAWTPPRATVIESSPDYITVTATDPPNREELWALGNRLVREEQDTGTKLSGFYAHGYTGLVGSSVAFGDREDSTYLRLSGHMASLHWFPAGWYSQNCSRLDLACTARVSPNKLDLGRFYNGPVVAKARDRGAELTVKTVGSNKSGTTLYIGSRRSEFFARLYDKANESKEPCYQDCWRWELECKGSRAEKALRQLLETPNVPERIATSVWEHFKERGAPPPWDRGDCSALETVTAPLTDDEKRLEWLRTQVRPSLRDMLKRYDRGYLIYALGLDEAQPDDDGRDT